MHTKKIKNNTSYNIKYKKIRKNCKGQTYLVQILYKIHLTFLFFMIKE